MRSRHCSSENDVSTQIEVTIQEIEDDLVRLVEHICTDLFVVFDFAKIPRSMFERHVTDFLSGRVS